MTGKNLSEEDDDKTVARVDDAYILEACRYREQNLPSYSAERFYLLSQIQQSNADLMFTTVNLKEKTAINSFYVNSEDHHEGSAVVLAVYIFIVLEEGFNEKNEIDLLMSKLLLMLDHKAAQDPANLEKFIEIDILVSVTSFERACQFAHVILRTIDSRTQAMSSLTGRAVSISSQAAACPGLERVACRIADRLHPGALRVLAESRAALLGDCPELEPDAVQGVYQWSVGDLEPSELSRFIKGAPACNELSDSVSTFSTRFANAVTFMIFLFAIISRAPCFNSFWGYFNLTV